MTLFDLIEKIKNISDKIEDTWYDYDDLRYGESGNDRNELYSSRLSSLKEEYEQLKKEREDLKLLLLKNDVFDTMLLAQALSDAINKNRGEGSSKIVHSQKGKHNLIYLENSKPVKSECFVGIDGSTRGLFCREIDVYGAIPCVCFAPPRDFYYIRKEKIVKEHNIYEEINNVYLQMLKSKEVCDNS